jgi:hypothetical protein
MYEYFPPLIFVISIVLIRVRIGGPSTRYSYI